ncbi:MAG: SDR family oxidoreductase [Planctomycetes bacterium]|nr:SDR family oxidoreductase [Planctomycetota bacterium]
MNRNVLVTGAGRGVGRACALAFAAAGDRVACIARTKSEIEAVADACRRAGAPSAIAIAADVTNPADVARAVDAAKREHGTAGVLCHAAGGAHTSRLDATDDAAFARMLSLNLTSAFYMSRAVLPGMRAARLGRIIYIGSTASRRGFRYCSAYAAAKHGLLGMARSLAIEVASEGITANLVAPGFLDADSTRAAAAQVASRTGKPVDAILESYKSFSPQNRMYSPEEVASTVLYLAGDSASGVNGQCLLIDGGETTA